MGGGFASTIRISKKEDNMRSKTLSLLLTTVLGTSLLTPSGLAAPGPTIEKEDKVNHHQSSKTNPNFSWDNPGPTSPVLHEGSIKVLA